MFVTIPQACYPAVTPSLLCNGRYLGFCLSLISTYNFTSSVYMACSFHLENLLKVEVGVKGNLSIPVTRSLLQTKQWHTIFLLSLSLHTAIALPWKCYYVGRHTLDGFY